MSINMDTILIFIVVIIAVVVIAGIFFTYWRRSSEAQHQNYPMHDQARGAAYETQSVQTYHTEKPPQPQDRTYFDRSEGVVKHSQQRHKQNKPAIQFRLTPKSKELKLPSLALTAPGKWCLGRQKTDKVQLAVPSEYVSRHHLTLSVDKDGDIRVKDYKSLNGTQINGKDLQPEKTYRIQPGDTLSLGHSDVIYRLQRV